MRSHVPPACPRTGPRQQRVLPLLVGICLCLTGPAVSAAAPKHIATLSVGMTSGLEGLALSPDGRLLAARSGGMCWLFDTATRKFLRKSEYMDGVSGRIGMLAFTPDGKQLVVSGKARGKEVNKKWVKPPPNTFQVEVWDVKALKRLRHAAFPDSIGGWGFLLPGGKELLLCGTKAAVRVKLDTLKEASRFALRDPSGLFNLSADGKLLAVGGTDGTLAVQETARGKTLMSVEVDKPVGKRRFYLPCGFAPDGKSVAVYKNEFPGHVVVFAVPSGRKLGSTQVDARRDATSAPRLTYLPDAETVVYPCGNNAAGFALVEPLTGLMWPLLDRKEKLSCQFLAFCPKTYLLATGDKDIRLWQLPKKAKDD